MKCFQKSDGILNVELEILKKNTIKIVMQKKTNHLRTQVYF